MRTSSNILTLGAWLVNLAAAAQMARTFLLTSSKVFRLVSGAGLSAFLFGVAGSCSAGWGPVRAALLWVVRETLACV